MLLIQKLLGEMNKHSNHLRYIQRNEIDKLTRGYNSYQRGNIKEENWS